MGAIKRTPADKAFSDCIRSAAEWTCERCETYYPEGRRMGLHCSHYHGRGKWGVRFNVNNAEALCYGCHQYLGANPNLHTDHKLESIGQGAIDILQEKANDTSLGRAARRDAKDIAKHYREEFKRIHQLRLDGSVGKLTITSWS
jgi:hypothetical protein